MQWELIQIEGGGAHAYKRRQKDLHFFVKGTMWILKMRLPQQQTAGARSSMVTSEFDDKMNKNFENLSRMPGKEIAMSVEINKSFVWELKKRDPHDCTPPPIILITHSQKNIWAVREPQ